MEDQPAGQGRENALQAHDQGSDGGIQMLLGDDLEGIGDAAGHDPRVQDGPEGHLQGGQGRRLEDEHEDSGQESLRKELEAGQKDPVH